MLRNLASRVSPFVVVTVASSVWEPDRPDVSHETEPPHVRSVAPLQVTVPRARAPGSPASATTEIEAG